MRFFDAIHRIMTEFERQQMKTKLPGMWPITINARDLDFGSDTAYTLGAMSDSLYEYLPKQHVLLGGLTDQYRNMYNNAADTFTKHNLYRPMLPGSPDVLFSGMSRADGQNPPALDHSMQHLVCFAGGMVGMGARIFSRDADLSLARQLVDGCIWAYDSLPNGLMAEVSHHVPCEEKTLDGPSHLPSPPCAWDEERWRRLQTDGQQRGLPGGYLDVADTRYILRPEAIESVFIWYRISGNATYQEHAWRMFEAVEQHTRTAIANAALDDVTVQPPTKADRMESFWMAETLNYFYLVFEDVEVVSLDDYVFNTEAHPLLRPDRR